MMNGNSDAGPRSGQAGHDIDEIPTIDCGAADEMFAPYLAHDLSRKTRDAFVQHIRSCCDCHDKLFALEFAIEVAARKIGDMDRESAHDASMAP